MAVVPALGGPVRVLWSRDRDRLPRVDHRDGARPHALTRGGLVERRSGGVGRYLRRRPRSCRRRYTWRGSFGGYHRRIGWRTTHSERLDICQRHEVGNACQKDARHRCGGNVWRPGHHGEHRRDGAHVAHYLSAVSNQNSHKSTVADLFAAFKRRLELCAVKPFGFITEMRSTSSAFGENDGKGKEQK
jgi:hypothetical protein